MALFLVFIFGTLLGSFINAAVFRIYNNKNWITDRSQCINCKNKLTWWQLIPVFSFLFLRGKCYFCKKNISFQYFWTEFSLGIIFVLAYYFRFGVFLPKAGDFLVLVRDLLAISGLFFIFLFDLKYLLVVEAVVFPLMIILGLLNYWLGYSFLSIIISGAIGWIFFALQYFISKGRWVGAGDLSLGLLLGVLLGGKLLGLALVIAYWLGTIIGLGLILFKGKNLKTAVPFGPFLAIGGAVSLIWGQFIIDKFLVFIYYAN